MKSLALQSPLTVVLRGLTALNIHCRDHRHTTNILVEYALKKGLSLGPRVCSQCCDANHTYYLHNSPLI